ncbi:hypothetical protein IW146_004903 [Coemansia sp. RSA 922]|nr:hypothetical protein IW146_004903 [Coemansia sp. RSA 922]
MMVKGTVSIKPHSTTKHSHMQPVASLSKMLDSYFKRKPVTNKLQQSLPPPPQPKCLRKGTS